MLPTAKSFLQDPSQLIPTSDYVDDLQLLKSKDTDWEIIEVAWKRTFKIRVEKIQTMKTIKELLDEFPIFSNLAYGHVLVIYNSSNAHFHILIDLSRSLPWISR